MVTYLLDTHVLVWASTTPERLGAAEQQLADADRRILSAVCVWELAIKQRLGKLSVGKQSQASDQSQSGSNSVDQYAGSKAVSMPIGQVNGVKYFGAMRVVDHNSAVNANTACPTA